jgi:hypothetical protein
MSPLGFNIDLTPRGFEQKLILNSLQPKSFERSMVLVKKKLKRSKMHSKSREDDSKEKEVNKIEIMLHYKTAPQGAVSLWTQSNYSMRYNAEH